MKEYIENINLEDISEISTPLIPSPSICYLRWEKKLPTYYTISIFDTCRTFLYLSVAFNQ